MEFVDVLCGSGDEFGEASVSVHTHDLQVTADIMASDFAGIAVTAAYYRIHSNFVAYFYIRNVCSNFCYNASKFVADEARISGQRVCTVIDSDIRSSDTAGCDAYNNIV